MSDTARFKLPLLDAAQAQKHVTVNEALVRTDTLAAGRVESRDLTAPPAGPADGDAHVAATGATGAWAGQDGNLALYLNGGWVFVPPFSGQRVWIDAEWLEICHVGGVWVEGRIGGTSGGAATLSRVIGIDHTLALAGSSTTAAIIPDKAVVLGVTGRVTTAITGATGWSLGVAGATTRYGSGYGIAQNAFAHGVTGQPQAYYGGTSLEITAEGGSFTAGAIRLAVHCMEIAPPDAA